MKTVIVGDTHGRSLWRLIYEMEKPDRMIFIGDYFDSFDIKGLHQLDNFKDIIAFKESGVCEVIMLIGNHDHHYFPEVGDTGTKGFQRTLAPSIAQVLDDNRRHLQMAYKMDDYLFTHAGVSSKFMDNVLGKDGWQVDNIVENLNDLFKYKPKTFAFGMAADMNKMSYLDPYGDNQEQSPIWIRPRSLMAVNRDTLRTKVIQIVGHTQVHKLDLEGSQKAAGGRYYFIDCLGTSGEYMIIEDGVMSVNTTKK
jgi:hypothetical protein